MTQSRPRWGPPWGGVFFKTAREIRPGTGIVKKSPLDCIGTQFNHPSAWHSHWYTCYQRCLDQSGVALTLVYMLPTLPRPIRNRPQSRSCTGLGVRGRSGGAVASGLFGLEVTTTVTSASTSEACPDCTYDCTQTTCPMPTVSRSCRPKSHPAFSPTLLLRRQACSYLYCLSLVHSEF